MPSASGFIIVVQEQRFQLACDDGTRRHFVLTHKAPIEGRELERLRERGARITVRYEDVPDLIMHVAEELAFDTGDRTA